MKRIAILGSTGSIGRSTLEVIRHFPDRFSVAALSTHSNLEVLDKQVKLFHPKFVCVTEEKAASNLKSRISRKIKVFIGEEGLLELCQSRQIDKVVLAISGSSALMPLLALIESKKDIALANKEAIVMAGPIIMEKARRKKVKIMPIDSEQSAIWQCLRGEDEKKIKNIYLTASGGPFWRTSKKDLNGISMNKVLKHPRWKMGEKITVDSATLMNKGFEVLETMCFFDVGLDKIKVLIHPEAIIHSMVEFIDGVILAQLSITDMRIPIQYALTYPQRLPTTLTSIDFFKLKGLHFEKPDFKRFPCLDFAYRTAAKGGTMPAVLNAANEVSVNAFLKRKLDFIAIPRLIERVLERHRNKINPDLGDILNADSWARDEAYRLIDRSHSALGD